MGEEGGRKRKKEKEGEKKRLFFLFFSERPRRDESKGEVEKKKKNWTLLLFPSKKKKKTPHHDRRPRERPRGRVALEGRSDNVGEPQPGQFLRGGELVLVLVRERLGDRDRLEDVDRADEQREPHFRAGVGHREPPRGRLVREALGDLADDAHALGVELFRARGAAQVQARGHGDRDARHGQRAQRLQEHELARPLARLLHHQQQRQPRHGHDKVAPLEDGEPLLREEVAELVDHAVVGLAARERDVLRDLRGGGGGLCVFFGWVLGLVFGSEKR